MGGDMSRKIMLNESKAQIQNWEKQRLKINVENLQDDSKKSRKEGIQCEEELLKSQCNLQIKFWSSAKPFPLPHASAPGDCWAFSNLFSHTNVKCTQT